MLQHDEILEVLFSTVRLECLYKDGVEGANAQKLLAHYAIRMSYGIQTGWMPTGVRYIVRGPLLLHPVLLHVSA